ncbi:MAG: GAF domain-containing protein, partial [Actinomycetota bacterium]
MVDTARARSEAAVRRGAILEAIAFAAQRFLETPHWEERIDKVLRRLGESTAVSRVYIFENTTDHDGALAWSQLHEWVAPGIQPQIDNPDLQRIPLEAEGFGRWADILDRGDIVHGLVSDFPESERPLLAEQDIRSILIVPILVAGEWWGSIGFDDCMTDREWTQIEIDALRAAAGTLGAA